MKIIKIVLTICLLCLYSTTAFADEVSHRKLAEEFMIVTEVELLMAHTFETLKTTQLKKTGELEYPGKSPEKDKVLQDRMKNYLDQKLRWSNFIKAYTEVYTTVFSEEELKAMVDFFSSPVGKKVQKNGLELRKKILESTQMQLKNFGFEVKKLEKDFLDEQKKSDPAK